MLRGAPPRLRSLLRYASVSAVSTAVGLSTLAVLVGIGHWPAAWANVVATAIGTVPSFELNRRWVWGRNGQRSVPHEMLPFAGLCLVELLVSTFAVGAASSWTADAGWSHGARTAVDLAANVVAFGTLWVIQYLVCDRILFARRSPADQTSSASRQGAGLVEDHDRLGAGERRDGAEVFQDDVS